MNSQQPSSTVDRAAMSAAQPKQEEAPKTIADLLDDPNAIADWNSNIEKIRQKESEAQSKRSS